MQRKLTALVGAVLFGLGSLAIADDPKPSKGTQFGQTIFDAVTAAIPVIKPLAEAVKVVLPSGDKIKKTEAEAAVKSALEKAQQDVDKARRDAAQKASAQLGRLTGIVAEIEIATELGRKSRLASRDLTVLRSLLSRPLSDATWDQVRNEWEKIAKPAVSDVVAFDKTKLDKLSDPDIQRELASLEANYRRNMTDLENQIKAENRDQATVYLLQIADRLETLSEAPTAQLKSFGKQLTALSERADQLVTPPVAPPPPLREDAGAKGSLTNLLHEAANPS